MDIKNISTLFCFVGWYVGKFPHCLKISRRLRRSQLFQGLTVAVKTLDIGNKQTNKQNYLNFHFVLAAPAQEPK